ncbi:cohesin domain-containing protein [Pelomonas cellulosilytica]|uniref:Cohesin domain-containing protein n=1 Tax=Pelomonas cellulosilytica TaxID=2906762 RepID=A0ABS8Y411_9BURK|nr:cohesin domain-containing protein [Pelomonas sp. P8]MCE4558027.1 cohesin domain-containing protein [Pelomonas sp. P8]
MHRLLRHVLRPHLAGAVLLLAHAVAGAASLSLQPTPLNVVPGAPFAVDLVVSGVGTAGAGSIGGFDLELSFDPAVLTLQSFALGGFLGQISQVEALDDSRLQAGTLQLTEVSLLPSAQLDALQPNSFSLATMHFVATSSTPVGGAQVSITRLWALGLANGTGLPVETVTLSGVTISAVPEGATLAMLLAGLAVVIGAASRPRRPARELVDEAGAVES